MRNMDIIEKVAKDRALNFHTNSAHPIDANVDNELLLTQIQAAFPDCHVYIEVMVTGVYDKKTYMEKRVRRDLKRFVENPTLCIVVDWSAL